MTLADKHYANKDKNKSKRRHGTVDIKNGDFILVNNYQNVHFGTSC